VFGISWRSGVVPSGGNELRAEHGWLALCAAARRSEQCGTRGHGRLASPTHGPPATWLAVLDAGCGRTSSSWHSSRACQRRGADHRIGSATWTTSRPPRLTARCRLKPSTPRCAPEHRCLPTLTIPGVVGFYTAADVPWVNSSRTDDRLVPNYLCIARFPPKSTREPHFLFQDEWLFGTLR